MELWVGLYVGRFSSLVTGDIMVVNKPVRDKISARFSQVSDILGTAVGSCPPAPTHRPPHSIDPATNMCKNVLWQLVYLQIVRGI